MGYLTQILAFVTIDGSYINFHTTFDRGPKVRLFCSPQCWVCIMQMTKRPQLAWWLTIARFRTHYLGV